MTAPLNAVTVHLTMDRTTGRTTFETEALAPADVSARIAAWTKYAQRRGLSGDDAKGAIIAGLLSNQHRETDGSYLLICAALWLAGDSVLRLEEPCTIVHEITALDGADYRFTTTIDPPPRDRVR
jgi:hypothetical protein